MKREGNKLIHKDMTAEFQPNGDIVASHGYTARLYNPCRKNTCSVSFEDLDDMTFQTWHSWDERQDVLDKFSLHKEGEKYCAYGDKSGRHCYALSGNVLTSERFPYIKGRLQVDGDIKWSHGYTSRADSPPCVSCKVGFEDWVGKKAESYKTDDPEKKIVDTFTVKMEGDQWWNKHWCAYSKSVGKQCMVILNESVLTPIARGPFWGWKNGLNEIEWHHGYTSRLVEDPCQKKSNEFFSAIKLARLYFQPNDSFLP